MTQRDPAAADEQPGEPSPGPAVRPLDEQMLADWSAVGLRRMEAHLARHAAFCDFLRHRPPGGDEQGDPCLHPDAP